MATVVDELVTKYTLDASGYKRGAGEVSAASKKAASAMGGDGGDKVFSSGIKAAGVLGGLIAGVAAAFGVLGAEVEFAKASLNKFLEYDTATSMFAGALGSLEKAQDLMKGLQGMAKESLFHMEDLVQVTTRFTSAGMDVGRFLPLAEKFALVVSGTNPQGLEQVAGAFMKLKGGAMGEAMEIFRKAGVSSSDLRREGVQMDKGGQITSSPETVLKALEKIVGAGSAIDGIVQELKKSKPVQFSSAMDSVNESMVNFGREVAYFATPYLKTFADGLDKLNANGGVAALAGSLTRVAEKGLGTDTAKDPIQEMAENVYVFNEYMGDFIRGIKGAAEFMSEWMFGAVGKILGFNPFGKYSENKKTEFRAQQVTSREDIIKQYEKMGLSPDKYLAYMKKKDDAAAQKAKDALKTGNETPPTDPVARNTQKMVELQKQTLDLHKMVFGNGVAAGGIAAEDLSDFRSRRRSPRVNSGNSTLRKVGVLLAELAQEEAYAAR